MAFRLEFETDNDIFAGGHGPSEARRILNHVRVCLANEETEGRIYDVHGNSVGSWAVTWDAEEDS